MFALAPALGLSPQEHDRLPSSPSAQIGLVAPDGLSAMLVSIRPSRLANGSLQRKRLADG
jgi:hypothetical protein